MSSVRITQAASVAAAVSPVDTLSTRLNNMERNQKRERERAGSEGFSLHTITRAVASNYPKRRPQGTHPSLQSVRASNRCRELAGVVSKLVRTSVPKQLHQGVHCRLVSWLF